MKNPLPLSNTWNSPVNKNPVLISLPSTNKKFKRKSREPKRFFTGPEPERMKTCQVDVSDVDWVDDTHTESQNVHKLAPLQRHLMMSQEAMASTTGFLSGLKEDSMATAQSEPLFFCSQESPRKRVGLSADGPGRLPEVKAIQQTRRLLANARERTRVHTISAAFEALRKQVPCYSYGQKLSKLAILRIACNYILSLAQLAELDYSSDHSSLNFSQCVEQCTRTLQAEGRSKKRKVRWHSFSI
uniref:Protein atonal homolog 8 n=1 Tax=Amphilophus citrinellus TaxID=61819 RepID=A0A3Q0SVL2_AMPCI